MLTKEKLRSESNASAETEARNRALLAVALGAAVVALTLTRLSYGTDTIWRLTWQAPIRLLELAATMAIVLWCAAPRLKEAFRSNSGDLAFAIAAMAALAFGVLVQFVPIAFPSNWLSSIEFTAALEPAALIGAFGALSRWTQLRACERVGFPHDELKAWRSRPQAQSTAAMLAHRIMTVIPLVAAPIAFAVWLGFGLGPSPAIATALYSALSLLVVAAPRMFDVAESLPLAATIAEGSKEGTHLAGPQALETLASITLVAFDKTFVTTAEAAGLSSCMPLPPYSENQLLALAASADSDPANGVIMGVVRAVAAIRGIDIPTSVPNVRIGSREILENATTPEILALITKAEDLRQSSQHVWYVTVDGRPAGLLATKDNIPGNATSAISSLRARRVKPVLLTSDNRTTASAAAVALGLDPERELIAELRPDGRAAALARLREAHPDARIAFAAHRAEDAAEANPLCEVTLVTRATRAPESNATVFLERADLYSVARLLELSERALKRARRLTRTAIAYHVVAFFAASGLGYAVAYYIMSPMTAALLSFSMTAVVSRLAANKSA